MPYLNWKEALPQELAQEVTPLMTPAGGQPVEKLRLDLGVGAARLQDLLEPLREVFSGQAGELRLDLPRNWVVFWKLRDGESRLLIAHPQQDEWVTTVALTPEHASALLARLESLGAGAPVSLQALAPVARVSNVEVNLSLL